MARVKSRAETQQERKADRTIVKNRRALHEYFVLESLEVGIVLSGTEIKSVREGKVQMADAYARIDNGELWLIGMHISPYSHGSYTNHEPDRPRKLMAHRDQIAHLKAEVEQKGLTLIPIKLYLKRGRAKVELGLCRGKKLYDKRQTAADRESQRDIARALRDRE
jgi:SsrA-binding protein